MKVIDRTPDGYFHPLQLQNEDWERVAELPDTWVSSLGRVWFAHNISNSSRIAKITIGSNRNSKGYKSVAIKGKNYAVHRLVAHAFIDNNLPIIGTPQGLNVDHINTNPNCNEVWNLRICTQKENLNNQLSKLKVTGVKSKFFKGYIQAIKDGVVVATLEGDADIEKFLNKKNAYVNVHACCNGKLKTAYGYQWKRIPKPS